MSANVKETTNDEILLIDIDAGIARLTLNRPRQYNALSGEMLSVLQNTIDNIAQDNSIRVVIIAANGKAFCAGHDLKEVRSSDDPEFHKALFSQCSGFMQSISQLPQPVIAEIKGIATAAGCQLVAACDLAIAEENARFAVSGINVGLFCSTPAVALSRNMHRKQAMKMLLTGEFIDAMTAQQFGLINEVVSLQELTAKTKELAEVISNKSALAIGLGKKLFYQQLNMDLSAAYNAANETIVCNIDSYDAREGIDAFIEKRKPKWNS
ncbi:MAG: enoyl-CoA hydratase [marine bacterium B5-7]|nr:MAG: enoyl-CoA hydratase [marine bacterium B5-7]